MSIKRLAPRLLPLAFALLALAVAWFYGRPQSSTSLGSAEAIGAALETRHSGDMLEVTGRVSRILADDREGSRHQRFILALDQGETLLVAHNIDLAPRVPLEVGDTATVRGQYEWNERGGVVHWTHHDPDGSRRDTGWIEHRGRVYE